MSLIHLFRRCNQRCVFCSYPAEGGEEGGASLKAWLSELAAMPPGLVQISGGEPLLAPAGDLRLLLAAVRRLGRRAELQTNAVAAADMKAGELAALVKALNAADGYFNVNFPADTAGLDYATTRTRGAFGKRLTGVRRLIKTGARVRLTHVISSLNYRRLPGFAAFAVKKLEGVSWVQFSYIKGTGRGADPRFLPRYAAVRPFLGRALLVCEKNGLRCEVDHIPPCFLGGFYRLNVDIVKMEEGLPGPHLAEKARLPECSGCRYLGICPGPRKDYIAVHGKL